MSFADLRELRWFDIDVQGCRFDHADLKGLRCWGISVRDCSFVGVDIRESQWGARLPDEFQASSWTNIDFRRADLRWSTCQADLESIDFSGAKFTRTDWDWSNLRDVVFGGIVDGLEIGALPVDQQPEEWRLDGVDFSRAKLRNVVMHGVNLGAVDVRLPSDDAHWIIQDWPFCLQRVEEAARALNPGELQIAAVLWVEYGRRDTGSKQSLGFVSLHDIEELGGAALVELLEKARRSS